MAFIIKDRVKVNTTTTGTGDITLGSAVATFDTFQSYMSDGDTTYYAIVTKVSNTDEWEVGIGTWNTGNTLTRTTVLAGSNGTSAVNFTAGDKDVFMTYPASKAVYTDASGNIDINGGTIDGATVGATSASTGKFTTLQTTSNADIGGYVDLEILSDHAAYQEGRVWYDSIHKTLNFYSDVNNVVHELGIEEHQRVYNNTGSTISKGAPLYFSGNYTAGTIDVPTVGLADATDVNAYNAQGLAAADIADGAYGYCIIAGQLTEVDTSGLTAGTNFFVGLTPGAVQNASPTYPNYPMCLGWVVNSDATDGVLLVNQQNHSVNSFRVRTDAHIGGDFQVDGDLTVLGTTTSVSTSDVTAGAPFYRANEGDAIGEAGTTFSGSGLDDAFFSGHFTGTTSTTYYVKIDGTGTPDTFSVSTDNFATTISTGNAITGSPQLIHSADNIYVEFGATTGHTLNDVWTGTASPINVDTGFFSNRNTGTSGVGYTHVGFYFDVSEGKWVLLDEYDPTPSGSINLADSSTSYGTLKVDSVEGNLTGNVTGNVSGNATTATSLATSRNIGGVAFNGTADIDLPGVNTSGNQDTSGNAATATALATARTIQLSGDVTGSASFDGSANISITAVVQDDSHAHTIANVDGLQAALDAKADDTTTISAGNGLTGGGSLGANRTLTVGAGSGISVTADAVAHADTSSQSSVNNSGRTYIQDITLDGFGHVTGLTSATETVTDTNQLTTFVVEDGDGTEVTISHGKEWKFVEGGGIDINWTDTSTGSDGDPFDLTIKHVDTSSQSSVNNSNGTVIQDVTLDTYGHVTGLGSVNLDSRFVNVTGDTMSGNLTVSKTNPLIRLYDSNTATGSYAAIEFDTANNQGIAIQFNEFDGELPVGGYGLVVKESSTNTQFPSTGTLSFNVLGDIYAGATSLGSLNKVFHDGYHPNADKWTTARTLSLTGEASGSVSWDGSANASLSVTLSNTALDDQYVDVTGDTMTGRLYIDSTSNDKLILRGSNDPSMELQNASDQFRGRIGISNTGKEIRVVGQDPDNTNAIHVLGIGQNGLRYSTNNGGTFYKVWHANNDGSGSGLNADTLDGSHASAFALASHSHSNYITSNANDTGTGSYSTTGTYWEVKGDGGSVAMTTNDGYGNANLTFNHRSGTPDKTGSACRIETAVDNSTGKFDFEVGNNVTSGTAVALTTVMSLTTSGATILGNTAWHAGNDGASSGLDADLLDGQHGSYYLNYNNFTNTPSIPSAPNNATITLSAGTGLSGGGNFTTNQSSAETITFNLEAPYTYIDTATGNYGTIKVDDDRSVTWAGYAIRDDWVFMSNGAGEAGIYNDTDNEWAINCIRNGAVELRYNGSIKMVTTSAGIEVTGDVNSTSDIRYKKNIEPIDSALEKVQALRGVTFDWDNDAFAHNEDEKKPNFTERATGVIAQDVEKVLPEAVHENEDGFKNVAYGNMVGLLIEAIKEQQKQINELREKLNG